MVGEIISGPVGFQLRQVQLYTKFRNVYVLLAKPHKHFRISQQTPATGEGLILTTHSLITLIHNLSVALCIIQHTPFVYIIDQNPLHSEYTSFSAPLILLRLYRYYSSSVSSFFFTPHHLNRNSVHSHIHIRRKKHHQINIRARYAMRCGVLLLMFSKRHVELKYTRDDDDNGKRAVYVNLYTRRVHILICDR